MRNIDLGALHIFRTVAEQGGITRAAAKLHRVQSNVTTRVKQLEARLGTRLFERANRRLTLTAEGRILLGYAEQLLSLSQEAESVLQGSVPMGTLRLGTLESTAAARLPALLARYHKRHPKVRIEMRTGTTGALVARLAEREIDAAFVSEPFHAEGLRARTAFVEELVLIAPRDEPALSRAKSLAGRTLIAFEAGCSYRSRVEGWLNRAGVVPNQVLEFASYHAIVACVAAGVGVAVVPGSVLATTGASAGVSRHALPKAVARARTRLVWRASESSPAIDALRALLPGVKSG